jgi:hypothetical protein
MRSTYSEADIAHPELFQTLKDWRSRKAETKALPITGSCTRRP